MSKYKVFAKELVNDREQVSSAQYTVPRSELYGYTGILNERGNKLLEECLQDVQQHKYNGCFSAWEWDTYPSGDGFTSPVWNNRRIIGILEERNDDIMTSMVLFWGPGWCRTISGSLYEIPMSTFRAERPNTPLIMGTIQ